jgi:methionine biosynthesis protein MetW
MVILSRTLQAVQRPDILLDEMLRVGRRVVISFLNFGSIGVRLQLLSSGEMPQTRTLPDSWYETPNIHHGTIRDFRRLCREKNVAILREIPLGVNAWLARMLPNLFAQTCVFVLGREGPKA